ncbi:hypothetical protein [Enterobacter sp.]|uniref:hypothetical protein n=1 Tax=Enterobacter sp. TaxID=42895 RepID=UPI00296EBDB5|nr:hypothetical protein [Enterobacter sp.]
MLDGQTTCTCDQKFSEVLDGHWLININRTYSVRMITRLPKGMIKISIVENSFEGAFSDIDVIACIRSTIVSH